MLTEKACKNAAPKDKVYKLADGGGMYLEVHPNGAKYWRLKYRKNKKEQRMAFGTYPKVTLAEARQKREAAKGRMTQGLTPSASLITFEELAREWHTNNKDKWSPAHCKEILYRLERDVFPEMGADPAVTIKPARLLAVIRKIEDRGARETARRCLQMCSNVFRYGIATEKTETNPAADLVGALKPVKKGHFAAFDSSKLPGFLKKLENNDARLYADTRRAIWLILYTFTRTSELIKSKKSEIGEAWEIPVERMKMKRAHIVPLSKQAKALIKEQMEAHPSSDYLFPNVTGTGHMSENTILFGIYRMGYKGEMTGHGFRALAMSTIKEVLGYRHEVVDRQLAHVPVSKVDRAYDRAKFLPERKKMMQEWADYIDSIRHP
jgi:integrase